MPNRLKPVELGRKYGHWTVLCTSDYRPPDGRRRVYYDCRCDCGFENAVRSEALRGGLSIQCSKCASKTSGLKSRLTISTGTMFGKWTVIGLSSHRIKKGRGIFYDCRCACGVIRATKGTSLNNGASTQCRSCSVKSRVLTKFSSKRRLPYEALFTAFKNLVLRGYNQKRITEFTLSFEDFTELMKPGRCHYCFAPLKWSLHGGSGRSFAYQMDRKDNKRGYSIDNTVPCCKRCNYGKGAHFSYAEWMAMTELFRNAKHFKFPTEQ